ncbi:uncharacterized protein [Rutidosis leptorrhynchoides]|uniref:uncharacterized protein n=1 Tax=Rutidosis leptorrhynchoides TaxID=125765 RepID=UPI003A9926C7
MVDVNHFGFRFTWNQSPNASTGILKKIDRVMENDVFISRFTNAYIIFQPYRTSDHCLAEWRTNVQGYSMYRLVNKLRMLKTPIQRLMWCKGDIHKRVVQLRDELESAQKEVDAHPYSTTLREKENIALKHYNEVVFQEESLLKQKLKIEWLRVGYCNSNYFHKVVKWRLNRSRIDVITDADNHVVKGAAVPQVFVRHYENFLGCASTCDEFVDPRSLFTKQISQSQSDYMAQPVLEHEIRDAIFDIGNNKSPGPDDFTTSFFKDA